MPLSEGKRTPKLPENSCEAVRGFAFPPLQGSAYKESDSDDDEVRIPIEILGGIRIRKRDSPFLESVGHGRKRSLVRASYSGAICLEHTGERTHT